uniref:Uncharacterized protein n=1 Tax=Cacopsylla melanoneura TaxID=428564 RepID=A0A8D9AS19_9HEMI
MAPNSWLERIQASPIESRILAFAPFIPYNNSLFGNHITFFLRPFFVCLKLTMLRTIAPEPLFLRSPSFKHKYSTNLFLLYVSMFPSMYFTVISPDQILHNVTIIQ